MACSGKEVIYVQPGRKPADEYEDDANVAKSIEAVEEFQESQR